jgi:hypothetical protein
MEDYQTVLNYILNDKCMLHFDSRLRLKLNIPGNPVRAIYQGNNIKNESSKKQEIKDFNILNEIVIDRGPWPTSV